jgi:hypothetical protein
VFHYAFYERSEVQLTPRLSQRETVSHEDFAEDRRAGRAIRKRQMPALFSPEGHLFWLSEYGRLGCCRDPWRPHSSYASSSVGWLQNKHFGITYVPWIVFVALLGENADCGLSFAIRSSGDTETYIKKLYIAGKAELIFRLSFEPRTSNYLFGSLNHHYQKDCIDLILYWLY